MSKPRIIYDNVWRTGTILSANSENPQFPATDTQADTPSLFWRSANNSNANESITIDLLTAKNVDFVAFLNHNLGENAVIKWRACEDANFSSNVTERTITHSPTNIYHFFGANNSTANRYGQISIADNNASTSYFQIGAIVAGSYWELSREIMRQFTMGKIDVSEIEPSQSLVEYGQPRPRRRVWSLPFIGLSDTDSDTIVSFFDTVGVTYGFILCFDANSASSQSYFVRNLDLQEPQYNFYNSWDWTLRVVEKL